MSTATVFSFSSFHTLTLKIRVPVCFLYSLYPCPLVLFSILISFNAAVSLVHAFVFSCLYYLRWSPRGLNGEVEAGSSGCSATYWRVQEVWPHIPIYAGCIALASIPTAHFIHPWCGGACLAGGPARGLPPALFLCRPSYAAV